VRGTVSVLLLIVSQSALVAQGSPKEPWLCRTYSGKGNGTITVRQARTLRWYTNHLPDFDPEVAWRVKNESGWEDIKAVATQVGTFHKHDVACLLFTISSKPSPIGKLVLVGDPGQLRPVIWILAETDIEFAPSAIVHVADTTVLVNRDRVSGTGGFYLEDYFVFDDDSEVPINLRVDEVITSPKGPSTWESGLEGWRVRYRVAALQPRRLEGG
jgi:hypothetical protein